VLALRKRPAIHVAFSAATVVAVVFGTFGPTATATVGWLVALVVIGSWSTFAVVDTRRRAASS
jgi:hypothetical protein